MRPTIPQVRSWRVGGDILPTLKTAAEKALTNATELYNSLSDCSRVVDQASGWYGHTRDAAYERTGQEVDHGYEVRNLLLQLHDDALDAHREFGTAVEYVIKQVELAEGDGCTVMPSGAVIHPDTDDQDIQDKAGVYRLNIIAGLDEIERIDGLYGPRLRGTQQMLASIVDGQPDVTTPDGSRMDPDAVVTLLAGMTPDQRAAYLAGMSPEDVRQLVIANPEQLGNMNGVPFDTRIAANEINIRNALYEEQHKPNPDQARISQLEKMLAPIPNPAVTTDLGMKSDSSASPVDDMVDRKFVMFDPNGNGRMIEMIGDMNPGVSGAGVYVPGTTTNLNGSETNHNAAWNIASRTGGPMFLYMEGDFPQSLADPSDGAPSPIYAKEMAPMLVDFGREVDREVALRAPGTPVSYVAHSYGGSILGTAEQLGLRADRVLYSSSAGTGIYDMPWNNANPDVQRFSQTAPADPIGIIQSYPRDSIAPQLAPFGNPHAGMPLGGDPDEIPGVTRLDTGYYGEDAEKAGHEPGEVVFGTDGHGKYWDDPSSTAFKNIVGVIAGTEATEYVERGIETDLVDVGLGDDGDGAKEVFDATKAAVTAGALNSLPGVDNVDPYADPHVTDNPQLGPRIEVR
ncbi:MotE family protein [Nocardia otitidiscaviarum]|uniref:hypothetical protein n=1 Tax=Nocardia otitidiscaviarum TaxID=1823 RepID=UPI001894BDEA|nr:hypothetical protein [Nocardia otitidiscaviarum]MBF6183219.1 hypothetical protein [Nocardia otitidiscaviarum]